MRKVFVSHGGKLLAKVHGLVGRVVLWRVFGILTLRQAIGLALVALLVGLWIILHRFDSWTLYAWAEWVDYLMLPILCIPLLHLHPSFCGTGMVVSSMGGQCRSVHMGGLGALIPRLAAKQSNRHMLRALLTVLEAGEGFGYRGEWDIHSYLLGDERRCESLANLLRKRFPHWHITTGPRKNSLTRLDTRILGAMLACRRARATRPAAVQTSPTQQSIVRGLRIQCAPAEGEHHAF